MSRHVMRSAPDCGEQIPASGELYRFNNILHARAASDQGRSSIDIGVPDSAAKVITVIVGKEQRSSKTILEIESNSRSSHIEPSFGLKRVVALENYNS